MESRQEAMARLVQAHLTPQEQFAEVQRERAIWRERWARWTAANPGRAREYYRKQTRWLSEKRRATQRRKLRHRHIDDLGKPCVACGCHDHLEVHHKIPGGGDHDGNIEVRCKLHHRDPEHGIHGSLEWWARNR